MKLPTFIQKMFHLGTAPEGAWRPTAGMGERGTIFSIPFGDGFQRNLGSAGYANGTVMSCIMVLSRVLAASYPNHVRVNDKGGRNIVTTSAASRLILQPNVAQNTLDWVSYVVFCLCLRGNAYFYVQRNDRQEPIALIPIAPNGNRPFIVEGELFYDISEHADFPQTLDMSYIYPARDIFHIKLPSRYSILTGDSLLSYAYGAVSVNDSIQGSSAAFYANMNRPSGILSTDQSLTAAQMTELREKFDEVSKGMNAGKVPILAYGLKWQTLSVSGNDAQVIENYGLSVLDICRVFGVPIQLLGQETNGAASSVSTLLAQFKTGNLLYMAELIEFSLESLFKMDHIKDTFRFDLENVARADFATEIESLSKAVQNSIFSPNEARNRVGNDSVEYGDEPRTQAQNVRLQDAVPAQSAPTSSTPPPSDEPPESEEPDDTEESVEDTKAYLDGLIQRAQKEMSRE